MSDEMRTIQMEVCAGDDIGAACTNAVKTAIEQCCNVEFKFNEQILIATPETDPAELRKDYMDECDRRYNEYIESPEYKAQQEKYAREEREREIKVNAMLSNAPEHMRLSDSDFWKKTCDANTDDYGGAVIMYSERWARIMEWRMSKGEKLEDIADECSHLADIEGVTGFMYGCAVGILSKCWQHGETLRRWHNLKTQIRDEGTKANECGGVLNPAVISIG